MYLLYECILFKADFSIFANFVNPHLLLAEIPLAILTKRFNLERQVQRSWNNGKLFANNADNIVNGRTLINVTPVRRAMHVTLTWDDASAAHAKSTIRRNRGEQRDASRTNFSYVEQILEISQ